MAELELGDGYLKTGLELPVILEQAIPGALLVCLKHESKIYRGVLMDTTNRDLPLGVTVTRGDLEKHHQAYHREEKVVVDPNQEPSSQPKTSAVGLRHTYTPDALSDDPSKLPKPHRELTRPLRDKHVRSMRLRPRQVLCSKCKQGVHDTKVKDTDAPAPDSKPPSAALISPRVELRRIRPQDYLKAATPKKTPRLIAQEASKTSPVIKISFATPQGLESVLKIPAKLKAVPAPSDTEDPKDSPRHDLSPRAEEQKAMNHEQYRKLKKALKKAKLKAKHQASAVTDLSNSNSPQLSQNTSWSKKRSKHGKHKRKHRHREEHARETAGDDTKENNDGNATPQQQQQLQADEKQEKEDSEWTENNNICDIPLLGNQPEEYSITNSDDFSLKHKLKRNSSVSRCSSLIINNDDSNSRGSFDSTGTGASSGLPASSIVGHTGSELELEEDSSASVGSFTSDSEGVCEADSFPADTSGGATGKSLTMRIQTKPVTSVTKCDRKLACGDVVWGKIMGFPWWPGRIVSQDDADRPSMAHVAWFGSSTMSHMACADLFPFLENFKLRFNKKKRGPYKTAIKQATLAAQSLSELNADDDVIDFSSHDNVRDDDDVMHGDYGDAEEDEHFSQMAMLED